MKQDRAAQFAAAVKQVEVETGIPWKVFSETYYGTSATYVKARRRVVQLLAGWAIDDLIEHTGWSRPTIKGYRARGAESVTARPITKDDVERARRLCQEVCVKHARLRRMDRAISQEELRDASWAEQARWEIAGTLIHEGMNGATVKALMKRFGVILYDDDIMQGHALCMPDVGADLTVIRMKARELDRGLARRERDLSLTHELAGLEAPYRCAAAGGSTAGDCVDERAA